MPISYRPTNHGYKSPCKNLCREHFSLNQVIFQGVTKPFGVIKSNFGNFVSKSSERNAKLDSTWTSRVGGKSHNAVLIRPITESDTKVYEFLVITKSWETTVPWINFCSESSLSRRRGVFWRTFWIWRTFWVARDSCWPNWSHFGARPPHCCCQEFRNILKKSCLKEFAIHPKNHLLNHQQQRGF